MKFLVARYLSSRQPFLFPTRSISRSGNEDARIEEARERGGRGLVKTRKNLQNTRHTATGIDWAAGVSSLLHEDQMTAYYSPLTPRYVGKEYGNTTWNRSRAAWIIIHFVLQATSTCCVGAPCTCIPRTRVCVSPRERRNDADAGLVDAGLLSRQNRFTWPASDKSSPGTVGYPLFTPFTTPRVPTASPRIHTPSVRLSGHWSGIARDNVTWKIIIVAILEIPEEGLVHWNFMNISHVFVIVFYYTRNRIN